MELDEKQPKLVVPSIKAAELNKRKEKLPRRSRSSGCRKSPFFSRK
jgi:hypothetical protein